MPDWAAVIREHLAGARASCPDLDAIVEEMSQHLDCRYAELLSAGLGEEQARQLTLEELDGDSRLREWLHALESRSEPEGPAPGERRRANLAVDLAQDLRYALRVLRRSPAFTAVAVLTLAVGVGASVGMFTVVNAVLLRPLPYRDPTRLVFVFEKTRDLELQSVAYPNFRDWRRQASAFSSLAAYRDADFNLTGAGQAERLPGRYISARFFAVLGVSPSLGRSFTAEEDRASGPPVVILSFGLWQRLFGADPGALGRTLVLDGRSRVIVGVAPEFFGLSGGASLFLPIEQSDPGDVNDRATHPGLRVVARLAPGVTVPQAQIAMDAIAARLAREYPGTNAGHGVVVTPMKDLIVAGARPTLSILVGAVALVLIIACANVANLMLARAAGRRRELAIRTALGADRGRVIRQLLAESLLVSVLASALGVLVAVVGTRLALGAVPNGLPRVAEIGPDIYVSIFTVGLAILTGIVTGLVPAFRAARTDPNEPLKEAGRSGSGRRRRAEGVFVAVEVALAVVVLVGAGLMVRTVVGLLRVDPGLNVTNVLTARVVLSHHAASSPDAIRRAYQDMLDGVRSLPGVRAAAITTVVPLGDTDSEIPYWIGAGQPPSQDRTTSAMFYVTTPDYLRVMQIPLRRGRFFTAQDRVGTRRVVVVDDVLAARAFPGEDPVGRRISLAVIGAVDIVGVVGHVKAWGLDADDTARIRDQIYFPLHQVPDEFVTRGVSGLFVTARTGADPLPLVASVRRQVAGPRGDQPAYDIRTMEQVVSRSLADRRFALMVLLAFAATSVFLSAIGVYGVVSCAVASRTHELGVRAALGASRRRLVRMVMRQGMAPALAGTACGVAAAWALSGLMGNLLYGVQPRDPVTFSAVSLLLLAVALAACLVPARRIAGLDPTRALRQE